MGRQALVVSSFREPRYYALLLSGWRFFWFVSNAPRLFLWGHLAARCCLTRKLWPSALVFDDFLFQMVASVVEMFDVERTLRQPQEMRDANVETNRSGLAAGCRYWR
ncbi:MAG: hypothetical protein COT71_01195 [Candidatus Andersenbacteria bacterium CG10_big_fil_rev_8_21_14_0_10_54_11]|uniref:Uncharacterized protein n=1 Tax=Candidatus Andersenbacteria bacterium CG10_big_fil_rev_8_21_14_0_10_54_11 TaxID=1974485 RepID=A0A2M6WZY2_9BACT|nr:MAG: hypothetical protein COT71_01195 [Candidatus Andersenbacteria bacterium CG10_big_fil_rev_8_21_14_0_10_54_11]